MPNNTDPKLFSKEDIYIAKETLKLEYFNSYGTVSPFFTGLKGKELLATRCTKCSATFIPPRGHCPECLSYMEWIPLTGQGTVFAFTKPAVSSTETYEESNEILAYVQVKGADTLLLGILKDTPLDKVKIGTEVIVQFVDAPSGSLTDYYFVPVEPYEEAKTLMFATEEPETEPIDEDFSIEEEESPRVTVGAEEEENNTVEVTKASEEGKESPELKSQD